MKIIKENFEDEDFEEIKETKELSGLGWREYMIEASRAYREKLRAQEATA